MLRGHKHCLKVWLCVQEDPVLNSLSLATLSAVQFPHLYKWDNPTYYSVLLQGLNKLMCAKYSTLPGALLMFSK